MEWGGKEKHLLNACYEPGTMNRKKLIPVFLYKSPKEKETALFQKVHSRLTSLLNLGQSQQHRKWLVSRGTWPIIPPTASHAGQQGPHHCAVRLHSCVVQLSLTQGLPAHTWNVPSRYRRQTHAHCLRGWGRTCIGRSQQNITFNFTMPPLLSYQKIGVGRECVWASYPCNFHLNYRRS